MKNVTSTLITDYRYVSYLLLQNGYILKLNYAFEFRSEISNCYVHLIKLACQAVQTTDVMINISTPTQETGNVATKDVILFPG